MSGSRSDDEEFERIVAGLDLSTPDLDDLHDDPPHGSQAGPSDGASAGAGREEPDDAFAAHGTFQPLWSDRLPEDEEPDDVDLDDEFVPPTPGPLPRGDRTTRLAWTALIGGPIALFLLAILDAPVPDVVPGTLVVAFVVALVVLLLRRGEHHRGDDPDHGAVI